jgi:putative ABC transport system permease protein
MTQECQGLVQDVRYGLRTLVRTPGFTIAALLTLALGIGANSAIFSVVNAVLLRPLPYPEPDRLVQLMWRTKGYEGAGQTGAQYLAFRDSLRSMEALAATSGAGSFNLVNGGTAEFVSGLYVSKEYFRVFGVQPAIGQPFTPDEDRAGGPDVTILSHALWRRQFGENAAVVGQSIMLGDKPVRVVGVMPESFTTPSESDLLLPLKPGTSGRGGGSNYTVVGRLQQGVTLNQAVAEIDAVYPAVRAQHGALLPDQTSYGFRPLQETMARSIRPALLMMLGAVALLLLIACANTASLLLARASGRSREIAVRAALGADRIRIVRQLLTESVILSLAGGLLGLLFAYWTVPALVRLTPPAYLITDDVRIDGTVLLVTLAVAVGTGLLFGLAPALSLSRHDLTEAFRTDGGGRTTSGRRSGVLRKALVVGEVALCMLLLVAAGLLIQTFLRLRAVDPGFDPDGVLTAQMSLQGERYAKPADLNRFFQEGLDRIRLLPGVRAAAVVNGVPIERGLNLNVDVLDGPKEVVDAVTDWRYATADYFETMRIPLVTGRGFLPTDRAGAPAVAVVSEEFVRRFFDGQSPIGHHIRVFDADGAMQIVGVARDLKEGGLKRAPLPVMYVPVAQTHERAIRTTHGYFQVSWVVRADNPGAALIRQIEEQIRTLNPQQPFSAFRTMSEIKSRAITAERFQMALLTAFAAVGLLLAAAGIYGLLAYSVLQRTREFGIRVALGATRGQILISVLRSGALLAATGVIIGTAAALALTRTLQNFVWGVSTLDPWTFLSVGLVLIVVSVVSSLIPALRAVRLDPVSALRL